MRGSMEASTSYHAAATAVKQPRTQQRPPASSRSRGRSWHCAHSGSSAAAAVLLMLLVAVLPVLPAEAKTIAARWQAWRPRQAGHIRCLPKGLPTGSSQVCRCPSLSTGILADLLKWAVGKRLWDAYCIEKNVTTMLVWSCSYLRGSCRRKCQILAGVAAQAQLLLLIDFLIFVLGRGQCLKVTAPTQAKSVAYKAHTAGDKVCSVACFLHVEAVMRCT